MSTDQQQPLIGTPEYDAAMAKKFDDNTTAAAASAAGRPLGNEPQPAQESQPKAVERPANVPEKFWNAEKGEVNYEAWNKSTTEAERRITELSQNHQQTEVASKKVAAEARIKDADTMLAVAKRAVETAGEDATAKAQAEAALKLAEKSKAAAEQELQAATTTTGEASDALKSVGLNFDEFSAEFEKDGKLSEASYAKLVEKGIPKDIVDAYIDGQVARAQAFDAKAYEAAGGQEKYTAMVQWAGANLSAAEIEQYNTLVNGTEAQMKLAVAGLSQRYTAENGSEPKLLNGNGGDSASGSFKSAAEMTAAMRDPRYQNDPAYRAEVEAKVGKSTFF